MIVKYLEDETIFLLKNRIWRLACAAGDILSDISIRSLSNRKATLQDFKKKCTSLINSRTAWLGNGREW